jgi:hypothetical protein
MKRVPVYRFEGLGCNIISDVLFNLVCRAQKNLGLGVLTWEAQAALNFVSGQLSVVLSCQGFSLSSSSIIEALLYIRILTRCLSD